MTRLKITECFEPHYIDRADHEFCKGRLSHIPLGCDLSTVFGCLARLFLSGCGCSFEINWALICSVDDQPFSTNFCPNLVEIISLRLKV